MFAVFGEPKLGGRNCVEGAGWGKGLRRARRSVRKGISHECLIARGEMGYGVVTGPLPNLEEVLPSL